jgi:hypothetical protein
LKIIPAERSGGRRCWHFFTRFIRYGHVALPKAGYSTGVAGPYFTRKGIDLAWGCVQIIPLILPEQGEVFYGQK